MLTRATTAIVAPEGHLLPSTEAALAAPQIRNANVSNCKAMLSPTVKAASSSRIEKVSTTAAAAAQNSAAVDHAATAKPPFDAPVPRMGALGASSPSERLPPRRTSSND
ncbi:hypothetical protein GCM10025760_33340 [Microbacterium yannicii]|uniref:Uncharacterized protein n=1 Tax=Microbacterium yannicii TaxID=671622 RepID=A0ABP9MQY4_9MICO